MEEKIALCWINSILDLLASAYNFKDPSSDGELYDGLTKLHGSDLSNLSRVKNKLQDNTNTDFYLKINHDIINLQKMIYREAIPNIVTITKDGETKEIILPLTNDFNARMNAKDLICLGTIYFLMLAKNEETFLKTNEKMLFWVVNAMRNRPYTIYQDLMSTLLYPELTEQLNKYLVIHNGDKDDMVRIVYLKLSPAINKIRPDFKNNQEVDAFMQMFIKSDVYSRLGFTEEIAVSGRTM